MKVRVSITRRKKRVKRASSRKVVVKPMLLPIYELQQGYTENDLTTVLRGGETTQIGDAVGRLSDADYAVLWPLIRDGLQEALFRDHQSAPARLAEHLRISRGWPLKRAVCEVLGPRATEQQVNSLARAVQRLEEKKRATK